MEGTAQDEGVHCCADAARTTPLVVTAGLATGHAIAGEASTVAGQATASLTSVVAAAQAGGGAAPVVVAAAHAGGGAVSKATAAGRARNAKAFQALADDSDARPHVNVVFAGHVDSGKSTMAGHVLVLTGQVDERTVAACKKEAASAGHDSWYLPYIFDTDKEERAKCKTRSTGRAQFETPARRYTMLDAPGHSQLVPEMISGAAQADVGVLVVSARRGEFEAGFVKGGQTKEHALLAKALGVRHLVVVVNKMDQCLVDHELAAHGTWDQARFQHIVHHVRTFLRTQCGFKVRTECHFLPVSGLTGANLAARVDPVQCPWYTHASLLETLDALPLALGDPAKPLRMPVQEHFTDQGTFVRGKVEQGTLFKGQSLTVAPCGDDAVVAAIVVDMAGVREVNMARPGENVCVRLAPGARAFGPGSVLCAAFMPPCFAATSFLADLRILELPEGVPLVTAGFKCILHLHTAVAECTVDQLLIHDTGKAKVKHPPFVKSFAQVLVKIDIAVPVAVDTAEHMPALGHLTLRGHGRTLAFGRVARVLVKKQ